LYKEAANKNATPETSSAAKNLTLKPERVELSSLTAGAGNGSFLNRFFEAAAPSHKALTRDADAIEAATKICP
jgi:hypothetical protein